MSQWKRIAVLVAAVTATGGLLASGGEPEGARRLPPVANARWAAECSACHLAYHPALLPQRSWRQLMAGLERHFGDNASLDAAAAAEVTGFLTAHAADAAGGRGARRVGDAISPGETPLRISETSWFRREHDEIGAAVWTRQAIGGPANCGACHPGAAQGDFAERRVRIPR